jgi:hypothetical protein
MSELFGNKVKNALTTQIIEMVDSVLMGDGDRDSLRAVCRRHFDSEELGNLERHADVYEEHYLKGFVRGLDEVAGEIATEGEVDRCVGLIAENGVSHNFIFVPTHLIKRVSFMDGLYWGRQVGISIRCRSEDKK